MSEYSSLKATINANVKANNNQEITGAIMNSVLNAMVTSLGAGYQFIGVATPTNPGSAQTPDYKCFYLATTPGTYTNLGGLVVADGEVAILKYDTSWTKEVSGIASADKLNQIGQNVFGELEISKQYSWSRGYVAGVTILQSQLSQFCQPVLFKAGEKLTYRTNSTYGSAVVQVSGNTPIAVGDTISVVQTLIDAMVANIVYEYLFTTDMWVVISVLASDYSLNVTKTMSGSIQEQIDTLNNKVNPNYTNNSAINAVLDEMYINGYRDGYYISYFVWNGTTLTIIVRDSDDNIKLFANAVSATPGEVFAYTQDDISIYVVLNSNTHLTSPVNVNFDLGALNIAYNKQIFGYIVNTKTDIEYPLNISRFDQGGVLPAGHRASWITINRRMDNEFDAVFNFANKTYPNLTNKWFDFYAVGKHARGVDGVSHCATYNDWDGINSLSSSDALMMAVIVGAVHNIDGDNLTKKWHTGGAHAYGDSATGQSPTMRELSNVVLADGKNIPVGKLNVKCRKLTIDVVNNIQGYNTCKADGTGREILQQRYHIDCTNDKCDIYVEYIALEDVIIYGANVVTGFNVDGAQYRFVGSSSKRALYTYDGGNVPNNGDNKINCARIVKNGYAFDAEYDLNYGIGNKEMDNSYNCFVTTAGKCYFANIPVGGQLVLSEGDAISWKISLNVNKNP